MDEALATETPSKSVYELAKALRDEGVAQLDLHFLFESYMEKTEDHEVLYDAVVDTMDEIWGGGWAKGGGLYPTDLSNEIVDAERRRRESDDALGSS
jgi:hypothetical protein